MQPRRFLFSGGPGVGKSTLLQALAATGHAVAGDPARLEIQARTRAGLPPRGAPADFARAVLARSLRIHDELRTSDAPVLFDTGVPEALALCSELGLLTPDEVLAQAARFRYERSVFFLPPWPAIHTTDAERDQPFAHTLAVHDRLRCWYKMLDFDLIDVPQGTVEARVGFVLPRLHSP